MFTKVLIAEDFDSINIALIQTLESMGVKEIEHAKYCDDALLKAKKAIQKGGDANEILEAMSHGLMKKFIHDPLTVLRNDPNLSQEDYEKVLHLLDRFYHYHIHHR